MRANSCGIFEYGRLATVLLLAANRMLAVPAEGAFRARVRAHCEPAMSVVTVAVAMAVVVRACRIQIARAAIFAVNNLALLLLLESIARFNVYQDDNYCKQT